MTLTITNETKNSAILTNESKGIDTKTWDEAEETWDEATYPWDAVEIRLSRETKNSAILTNESKN